MGAAAKTGTTLRRRNYQRRRHPEAVFAFGRRPQAAGAMIMMRLIPCIAFLAIVGCAGGAGGSSLAAVPIGAPLEALQAAANGDGFAACDKGTRVTIVAKGGEFKIPKCAGWSGAIGYPRNHGWYRWSITSSTTNTFGVPAPPSGVDIFYIQTIDKSRHGKSAPSFFNGSTTATVTSAALVSAHTYTLVVYRFVVDAQCPEPPPSGPCPPWVADIGSPAPGSNSITFDSPLNGALFVQPVVWQFVQN
jgi:hypothetical protein